MFAHQTTVISQHSNLDITITNLQDGVNILWPWFQEWRLANNPNKCGIKIFSLRRLVLQILF